MIPIGKRVRILFIFVVALAAFLFVLALRGAGWWPLLSDMALVCLAQAALSTLILGIVLGLLGLFPALFCEVCAPLPLFLLFTGPAILALIFTPVIFARPPDGYNVGVAIGLVLVYGPFSQALSGYWKRRRSR